MKQTRQEYVTCRACSKPVAEISKETAWEYQYHPNCRPWTSSDRQARQADAISARKAVLDDAETASMEKLEAAEHILDNMKGD